MNDELQALTKGVLADLSGAGVLADWLQEHGREREAVLLRRRWKGWQTARARNAYHWRRNYYRNDPLAYDVYSPAESIFVRLAARMCVRADAAFANYVRTRFAGVRVEDVPFWFRHGRGVGHAVIQATERGIYTACRSIILGSAGLCTRALPRAICDKCRTALTTMTRRVPEGVAT